MRSPVSVNFYFVTSVGERVASRWRVTQTWARATAYAIIFPCFLYLLFHLAYLFPVTLRITKGRKDQSGSYDCSLRFMVKQIVTLPAGLYNCPCKWQQVLKFSQKCACGQQFHRMTNVSSSLSSVLLL